MDIYYKTLTEIVDNIDCNYLISNILSNSLMEEDLLLISNLNLEKVLSLRLGQFYYGSDLDTLDDVISTILEEYLEETYSLPSNTVSVYYLGDPTEILLEGVKKEDIDRINHDLISKSELTIHFIENKDE